MFIDTLSNILLFTPLLMPLATKIGLDRSTSESSSSRTSRSAW
jgi:TRAP-type C4-dicarboxylate transport system permease large subunit